MCTKEDVTMQNYSAPYDFSDDLRRLDQFEFKTADASDPDYFKEEFRAAKGIVCGIIVSLIIWIPIFSIVKCLF